MIKFERQIDEALEDFVIRLADIKQKDKSVTWQSIADNVYLNYGISRSEAWVRKVVKNAMDLSNGEEILESLNETKIQIEQKTLEMKKERAKLNDQRSQINSDVRRISREETIKEIAYEVAKSMSSQKILPKREFLNETSDCEAILCISDWHYGLDFKNPWNEFNPEICKNRIAKLRDKTIKYIKSHNCKKIHLANLGDLIAGRIHLTIRLESRYDVITQTLHVSEILSEFINDLSKYANVNYYDCLDNHSRLEPDKKASLDLESLTRIIPWYLKERFKDNQRVAICENEFGSDLITFECMGHKIVAAHGDKDVIKNIDHLSMMTERHYDMFLTAHEHHFQCDEKNRCVAIGNSSLMGTDSYAQKLRLSATPSQNLIIATKENVTECIYRILL